MNYKKLIDNLNLAIIKLEREGVNTRSRMRLICCIEDVIILFKESGINKNYDKKHYYELERLIDEFIGLKYNHQSDFKFTGKIVVSALCTDVLKALEKLRVDMCK